MIRQFLNRLLGRATPAQHTYDWRLMNFVPDGDILSGFNWRYTPEGIVWWANHEDTPEGWERHEEMKRLYAADMLARRRG